MKKLLKKKYHRSGKDLFLLGVRNDGYKVYLEDFSWDCDWYWGGGYLEVFPKTRTPDNAKDICEHYRFDSFFEEFGLDKFQKEFKACVLEEKELWDLFDLMKSFYTLGEAAEVFKGGNSNYSDKTFKFKYPVLNQLINEIIEEKIIPEVRRLLDASAST